MRASFDRALIAGTAIAVAAACAGGTDHAVQSGVGVGQQPISAQGQGPDAGADGGLDGGVDGGLDGGIADAGCAPANLAQASGDARDFCSTNGTSPPVRGQAIVTPLTDCNVRIALNNVSCTGTIQGPSNAFNGTCSGIPSCLSATTGGCACRSSSLPGIVSCTAPLPANFFCFIQLCGQQDGGCPP